MYTTKTQETMVRSLFRKGISAFVSKQTNIFSAAFFIIITTVFSQILGVLKYRLLVSFFGASSDLGVFFAAFKVPDFLFQVIIAAALSSCFIPIFSEYISKDKKEEAFLFTSSLITIGLTVFVGVSVIVMLFAYQISSLVAPGLSIKELESMANLTRIIQLSQLFFVFGTLLTALLQSFQRFLIPGIASSLYNVGIIVGILLLAPTLGIYGATVGVLLGSILFCLVQLPLLKMTGFSFVPRFDWNNQGVMKIFKLMVPRSFTLLASQIAIMATLFFASFISLRSYSIFELAQTLVVAPVILFGQSIAQASFPSLSQKLEDREEFLSIFISSFNQILYLTLPISVVLIVLRIPVVRLFYGAKLFDWPATVDTGYTLAFFSLSLSSQALIYLLSRAFYAYKDTKTPFFITLLSVAFYIALSYLFILVGKQPIYYLAFSFSLSYILSILMMLILINKKITLPKVELALSVLKITIASSIMGVALYIPIKLLDQLVFDTTRTINLIILTGIASSFGLLAYLFFTWILDIREAYYIIAVFKKFGDWKKILRQMGELIDGSKLNP